VDPGCGNIILSTLGSEFILLYGSEEQKKRYLALLPKGEAIMGMAITEPDAGSDVSSIRTLAQRKGITMSSMETRCTLRMGTLPSFWWSSA